MKAMLERAKMVLAAVPKNNDVVNYDAKIFHVTVLSDLGKA